MVEEFIPPKRVDHFARFRQGSVEDTRKVDPTLEFEQYRITPELLRLLEALTLDPHRGSPLVSSLDDLIKYNAARAYRMGQDDMIQRLRSLMENPT